MPNIKDSYDVVVIGAGMSGLTCGALLAKEGLDVLMAERLPRVGGYCTSLRDSGFSFDPAVAILEGCDTGGIIAQTLAELKVEEELELVKLDPLSQIIGPNYNLTIGRKLGGLEEELKRLAPAESDNIDSFMQECHALYKEMAIISKGALDLMGFGQKVGFMKDFLLKCPRIRKYGGKSAKEVTRSFFSDPTLRSIFHGMALFLDPGTQATILLNMLGMMSEEDVFYPKKGGIQALPNVLAKAIERDGSTLALNTRVDRILLEGNKAIGVKLSDNNEVKTKYVVSAVDARQTFIKLIGEEHLSQKLVKELDKSKVYGSVLSISLGVDGDLRAMGIKASELSYCPTNDIDDLFGTDPDKCGLGIRLHSMLDSSQAPQGKGTVVIVVSFPYDYMDCWGQGKRDKQKKEYEELKQSLANKLIASAEKVIPGLSQHIVYKRVATPITLEKATLNSQGSAMGWYPLPGNKMRSQKTPLSNLYQAGHWTFPGGSVPAVVASGRNAARLVLKERQ
jgi:phytoene desaturase